MTTIDFSPFYRATIGFEDLFTALDRLGRSQPTGFPPYDITKTGDDDYRITLAVAGFAESELAIELRDRTLTIRGEKRDEQGPQVIYQGIAARSFARAFTLADHVVVLGAALENGLLHVDLARQLPEEMRPRTIPINQPQLSRKAKTKLLTENAAA